MSVEELRQSRNRATVYFMELSRLQNQYLNSIFCCFEGDDAKYYFKRIEDYTSYRVDNIIPFNCDGKSEVLRFYKLVKDRPEFSKVKLLYFVDRDFDASIKDKYDGLYETPVYSVENFYTTMEAFTRILKVEFLYTEIDPEFDMLLSLYRDRQQEFHEKTKLFNAWLCCEREKSAADSTVKLNLANFKIVTIVPLITIYTVEANYDKEMLQKIFPDVPKITDEEVNRKISEFNNYNFQEIFRGKFEVVFLYSFIESIKIEYNKPKSRLKKKAGVQLAQSKRNLIAEFSQYATTPPCLIEYLNRFRAA